MKIGIAGVGGIGSNVAMHLARTGDFKLKFGDFDKIDRSNLNRQFYFENQIGSYKVDALINNLENINKNGVYEGKVIKYNADNIKKYFEDCDILVDGFDNKIYKKIFVEELYDVGKLMISVSGIGGIDTSEVKVDKINENYYIVGDKYSDISKYKTYSHKVNLVSCKVVEIILRRIYEK